jgi:hypothetical protein
MKCGKIVSLLLVLLSDGCFAESGLEFGKQGADGKPEGVKYAGCGKILRVG